MNNWQTAQNGGINIPQNTIEKLISTTLMFFLPISFFSSFFPHSDSLSLVEKNEQYWSWFCGLIPLLKTPVNTSAPVMSQRENLKHHPEEYSRELIIHIYRYFLLQACGAFSLNSGYENAVLLTSWHNPVDLFKEQRRWWCLYVYMVDLHSSFIGQKEKTGTSHQVGVRPKL